MGTVSLASPKQHSRMDNALLIRSTNMTADFTSSVCLKALSALPIPLRGTVKVVQSRQSTSMEFAGSTSSNPSVLNYNLMGNANDALNSQAISMECASSDPHTAHNTIVIRPAMPVSQPTEG